jgi:hypothetical protein
MIRDARDLGFIAEKAEILIIGQSRASIALRK